MIGGVFRGLMVAALALLCAMFALMLVKAAFAVLVGFITLILPFVFVYWLVSRAPRWWGRIPVGYPHPTPRHAPRRRAWARLRRPQEDDATRWVREADRLAKEIARLVRRCERGTREALAGSPASARKLAERVRDLSRLCKTLDAHLRENHATDYRRQVLEMERRAATAMDAFAAEQYRAAAQSLESQALVCEELGKTRERLDAEVARILAALTNLRSRIVSMLTSPAVTDGSVDRAADELAHLEAQVDTFQDSVRQVLQQASHPSP